MKTLKLFITAILIAGTFIACEKDQPVTPNTTENPLPVNPDKSVEGTWIGKYGYDNDNPNIYYCFKMKADGTLEEWNSLNTLSGVGTWTMTLNNFRASTHFLPPYTSIFLLNSTLDTTTMKITGTWGYSPSTTNGGKFYLIKQ